MVALSAGLSPMIAEDSLAEAARTAPGSRAAAGSDWSNVRRFMDGIVAEDARNVQKDLAGRNYCFLEGP
jgi:hypothetical protein